jgi:hypothetical protein
MSDPIIELAEQVPLEHTLRFVCPHCFGGSRRERSLAITRLDNYSVAWICHRASCGVRGTQFAPGSAKPAPRKEMTRHKIEDDPLSLAALHPWVADYLISKFGAAEKAHHAASLCGIRMGGPRVITYQLWSVYNRFLGQHIHTFGPTIHHNRMDRGVVTLRNPDSQDGPLYGAYGLDDDDGLLNNIATSPDRQIWMVEDCLSAIRLYTEGGAAAISLLGTNVPTVLVRDIMTLYPRTEIILALDWDASTTALRQMRQLRADTGCNIQACLLRKDVKDLAGCDILKLVSDFSPARGAE